MSIFLKQCAVLAGQRLLSAFSTLQMCVVASEEGSYLRLIGSCITQLEAQGPLRTCNESKEEDRISKSRFVVYQGVARPGQLLDLLIKRQ